MAEQPRIGAGHFEAMGRQGLAELRAAMYSGSNVAQPPGPGLYGTATQAEVMQQREAEPRSADEPTQSIFDGRMPESHVDARAHEPEPPGRDE